MSFPRAAGRSIKRTLPRPARRSPGRWRRSGRRVRAPGADPPWPLVSGPRRRPLRPLAERLRRPRPQPPSKQPPKQPQRPLRRERPRAPTDAQGSVPIGARRSVPIDVHPRAPTRARRQPPQGRPRWPHRRAPSQAPSRTPSRAPSRPHARPPHRPLTPEPSQRPGLPPRTPPRHEPSVPPVRVAGRPPPRPTRNLTVRRHLTGLFARIRRSEVSGRRPVPGRDAAPGTPRCQLSMSAGAPPPGPRSVTRPHAEHDESVTQPPVSVGCRAPHCPAPLPLLRAPTPTRTSPPMPPDASPDGSPIAARDSHLQEADASPPAGGRTVRSSVAEAALALVFAFASLPLSANLGAPGPMPAAQPPPTLDLEARPPGNVGRPRVPAPGDSTDPPSPRATHRAQTCASASRPSRSPPGCQRPPPILGARHRTRARVIMRVTKAAGPTTDK